VVIKDFRYYIINKKIDYNFSLFTDFFRMLSENHSFKLFGSNNSKNIGYPMMG
jgi:hypothetical protein